MRQHRLRAAACALPHLSIWIGAITLPSASSSYEFVEIVDATGPYSFFSPPSINASGTVAFRADLDAGGAVILSATPSGTTTIAEIGGSYTSLLGQFGITATGSVLFAGDLGPPTGGSGISIGDGVSTQLLYDRSGSFSSFGLPAISSIGAVAFAGGLDSGVGGIFVDGVAVADDTGAIDVLASSLPDINGLGEVAYFAESSANGTGIFRGPNPVTDTVADTSGPYAGFGLFVSINDAGTVAFIASLDDGVTSGVFTGPDPMTDTVADSSGGYSGFNEVAINAAGTVAFSAQLDVSASARGIFTGPDLVTDKVIRRGDALFGSTVFELGFVGSGLNDAGDIAFSYVLANARRGIAVAVVPEPASIASCAAVVAALLGLRGCRPARRTISK